MPYLRERARVQCELCGGYKEVDTIDDGTIVDNHLGSCNPPAASAEPAPEES